MASTSASSSLQKSFKYDVFLSFRGEDTRKNFVDHLYHALHNRGIVTYKDDERIEKGERISEQLLRSIEDSRFYIIVFSKTYASSSWCLEELAKIMECQRTTGQTAYPIFYDVEPTEVRNQSGSVGEAFERFTRKRTLEDADHLVTNSSAKQEDEGDVQRWRNALKEAAGLAGWELKTTANGHEAKFIDEIMEKILPKLYFVNSSNDENLVGMGIRVNKIVSSLEIGLESVRMIGIKGMGGAGKTTLDRAVFDHISIQFEGKSFVENVRECSKGGSGLKQLQNQILQDVLNDQRINVKGVYDGKNMMKKMMPSRKVLVVLDDVDHIDQLKALAGSPSWFKPGSKVIITTRDKQVLKAHRVNFIHDVCLLTDEEAICLFSRCAFEREVPIQEYGGLSRKVVHYAAGLPLAVTVLGSFLCGRTMNEWEDALERLKKIPEDQTLQRLELSYNSLENDHKEIFLDVACILRGETKDEAVRILESCGFRAEIGLSVLEQKSLITISDKYRLVLHDLIAEMGWNIVRRSHLDEPSKHSRLWIKEEIEDILVNQSGTEATRCIKLQFTNLDPTKIMEGLRNMKKLTFLSMNHDYKECGINEVGQYLPDTLQCLHWHQYPFMCLPDSFQASKLVELIIYGSNMYELWKGGKRKVLNKLRLLKLSRSKLRTFDLGMTPNLETLDLERCRDFVELNMPTECPKLLSLKLSDSKLRTFDLGMTPNLETLDLEWCFDFVELNMPTECPKLLSLTLRYSKLRTFDLGMTPNLETLDLERCRDFVELNMPTECPKLLSLKLSGSKLRTFDLGMTPNLETLYIEWCVDFVELHMPTECPKLLSLTLRYSKLRTFDLGMTPNLETLDCRHFVELHMPVECPKLKNLSLDVSMVSNLKLGLASHIETLHLGGINDFVEPHIFEALKDLDHLKHLTLSFRYIKHLPDSICLLKHLKSLELLDCDQLEQLPKDLDRLECLEELHLRAKKHHRFGHNSSSAEHI